MFNGNAIKEICRIKTKNQVEKNAGSSLLADNLKLSASKLLPAFFR